MKRYLIDMSPLTGVFTGALIVHVLAGGLIRVMEVDNRWLYQRILLRRQVCAGLIDCSPCAEA